jgi:hypothetical protein
MGRTTVAGGADLPMPPRARVTESRAGKKEIPYKNQETCLDVMYLPPSTTKSSKLIEINQDN